MIKALLILITLLGILCFVLVTVTATPTDRESYEAYERWKEERKRKNEQTD